MRGFTATVAVLVVAAGLVAAVPAGAVGDRAPAVATGTGLDGADITDTDPLDANGTHEGSLDARQSPDLPEQWRRSYGEDGDDMFSDLVRTDDGGYLVVGWTERETTEGWVMKIDGDGERAWERTLGGPGTDRFWGIARTDDGYLLAGRTDDGGATSGWLVEMDRDGEVREERTVGSGTFNALVRDESGENSGYLVAGWASGGEGWAVKLDDDRSREWQRSYRTPDGYGGGYLRAIVPVEAGERADGGYYLAGKVEGESDDAWALKVDSEGNPEWQTTAGGPDRDDVWAAAPGSSDSANASGGESGASDADGGFVLAGETGVHTDDRDGWLVKFDHDGSVAWERTPGSEGALWFDSAVRTEDGYLFTGAANDGPTGGTDGYALRTDDDGVARGDAYYATEGWDKPWPTIPAHDGGYLMAGQTAGDDGGEKDGWLVRIGTDSGDAGTEGGNGPGGTSGAAGSTATTDSAMRDGTTATDDPGSEDGVPGMGVGAALAALVAALLLARR